MIAAILGVGSRDMQAAEGLGATEKRRSAEQGVAFVEGAPRNSVANFWAALRHEKRRRGAPDKPGLWHLRCGL